MKRHLLECLAFLFLMAWAATSKAYDWKCMPYSSQAKATEVFTFPQSLSAFLSNQDKAGGGITWFCDMKTYWAGQAFYGWAKNADRAAITSFGTKNEAEKRIALDQFTKVWKPSTDDPAYGQLVQIANAQLDATRPAPIRWLTAKNGSQVSRPTFAVVKGIRQTSAASERVAINMPCEATLIAIEEPISGSTAINTYASVEGLPNANGGIIPASRVALCVRQ